MHTVCCAANRNYSYVVITTIWPGLALFEGQQLVTDEQGRIGLRIGHSLLTLAGETEVTIYPDQRWWHDFLSGRRRRNLPRQKRDAQIETINQAREVEAHRYRFRSEWIPTDDGW